jgi:uncharacterized protein YicC (UPF0701 family)
MLYSMTGFGRGISRSKLGLITTEIRAVNHRYLDLVLKLPKELQALEPKIKSHLKEILHRGRVEINIERRGGEHALEVEIDQTLARNFLTRLQSLGRRLKLKDQPTLSFLCQMPGVIELRTSPLPLEKTWLETKKSIDKALQSLLKMRHGEGKFIEEDIKKRLEKIRKRVRDIEKRIPLVIDKYKKLSSETGLSNEKIDVSEELSRFSSHLQQLNLFLKEKEDVGRKIDFTLQEMIREINTLSSKSNDFPVSQAAVVIKSEIEKIKEQIQNIE